MGAARFSFAVSATPDAAPNTTAPSGERTFVLPLANQGLGSRVWFVALGGRCTIQLWTFEPATQRWYSVDSAIALPQDVQSLTAASAVPLGVALFAQVTGVGQATHVIGGLVET